MASYWEHVLRDGLKDCEWFAVMISKNSIKSEWVKAEVHWALDNRKEHFIPIIIDDTSDAAELHLKIIMYQIINWRNNIELAKKNFLSILGEQYPRKCEMAYRLNGKDCHIYINGNITIGRDSVNQIHLSSDGTVSRNHAILKIREETGIKTVWLLDLGTRHGTILNGVRISGICQIFKGDIIHLGETIIEIKDLKLP